MNDDRKMSNEQVKQEQKLLTIRLLIISMTIYFCAFVMAIFSQQFGISRSNVMSILLVTLLVAIAINVAGFVFGFYERKENLEMAVNGIVGNLIPIIIAVIFIVYVINALSSLGPLLN